MTFRGRGKEGERGRGERARRPGQEGSHHCWKQALRNRGKGENGFNIGGNFMRG